jgi:translation initiation factor IF-2
VKTRRARRKSARSSRQQGQRRRLHGHRRRINRGAQARLLRKGQVVAESRISTLRRFKDDASEVRAGYECGIQLDNVYDYQAGDMIECFEILKIKASL